MLMHVVAVTRYRDQYAIEAMGPDGPRERANGFVRLLADGVADDVLGLAVVEALNEADRPLPEEAVSPAAARLGVDGDAALAEPGAARVIVEYDGSSVLLLSMRAAGREEGFVLDEDGPTREVLASEPGEVLGAAMRRALDESAGQG